MDSFLATSNYLTPIEGLLTHARLAEEGVESRVEGLDLVTWLWHLSLAFQGVRLVVRSDDALRAAEILFSKQPQTSNAMAPHQCGECGETLPGDWLICWRCGTDDVAHQDESFFVETIRPTRVVSFAEGVEYLGLWLVLAAMLFAMAPVIAFAFALMAFVFLFRSPPPPVSVSVPPEEFAASPDHSSTSEFSVETSRRALASSMFGLVWFPPLTLYSIWILLQNDDDGSISRCRRWRRAAWTFNFLGLLAFMSGIGVLLDSLNYGELSWAISVFIEDLFAASRGLNGSQM